MISLSLIIYSAINTQNDWEEKRQELSAMSIDELGEYILDKNEGTVKIDSITKIRNMHLNGNTLELPYYVKKGFLHKLISMLKSEKDIKQHIQEDTLDEDCSKMAFSIFLQKGGVMHYTYRLEDQGHSKYLYDFNNTWDMCPKDI